MNCKLIISATEEYQLSTIPSTYLELKQAIQAKFASESAFPFRLKYKDGEDELITLNSEEDFQTALITCNMEDLISLDVYVLREEANQSVISEPSQAEDKSLKANNEAMNLSFYEAMSMESNGTLFTGFSYGQFQRYSLPQTRKMSTDTNQTLDFEEPLNTTDILNSYGCRYSIGSLNRKSTSPNEKKAEYKVQFKSKFEYDALQVIAGDQFTYSFTMKNCGETQWPKNTKLVCVNGIHKKQSKTIPSLKAGEKFEMGLILKASEQVGKQLSQWRLHFEEADGGSKGFGRTFFIEINANKKQIVQKKEAEKIVKQKVPMIAKTCSSESEDYKRVLELGEALNDMFPGDLKGKVRFVESCPDHYSIYDLVDNYLLSLRGDNTKFSQNNYIIA